MELAEVMKIQLHIDDETAQAFDWMCYQYMCACNVVSQYIFDHDFCRNRALLSKALYHELRDKFGLKAQIAESVIATVISKYKTVNTQFKNHPKRICADGKWYSVSRDIRCLQKPICFKSQQADLVRGRDYSLVCHGRMLSINTLGKRIKCSFTVPVYMQKFLDGSWRFGTAKLVCHGGNWFLHISVTKEIPDFDVTKAKHVVGIDRGLRFIETTYDDDKKTSFVHGDKILAKRRSFDHTRAQLQSKGTKSAKRVLKHISGRENRWMKDVNHCITKTLVQKYGKDTLFVLEDLEEISSEDHMTGNAGNNHDLRNWAFYDFEQKLTYKAHEAGSKVQKVDAAYTSQRCPICGQIRKENRNHDMHMYCCSKCGFQTNDDRVGAMNIWQLGKQLAAGIAEPTFRTMTKASA